MSQPPLMSDAEVFGADHPLVYGAGAPESGGSATPQQQAYATSGAGVREPAAPVGTATNPSYDTPSVTGGADSYHVTTDGKLNDPNPQMNLPAPAKLMSDADVFGIHGGQGAEPAAPDTRPTDEGLGFKVGVNNVVKNYIDAARGGLPKLPGQADGPLSSGDVLTLLPRIAQGFVQTALDKDSQTKRPGTLGKIGGEIVASAPLAIDAEAPAIMGAVQGLMTSEADSNDMVGKLKDAAIGAFGGKVADKIGGAVKAVVLPKLSAGAKWAADQGIRLTPGAILGGAAKGVEDAAAKGTISGPLVSNAQRQMLTDANLAATNNALKGAGLSLPADTQAGTAALDQAHHLIGGAYDSLAPKLTIVHDQPLADRLAELEGVGANLDPQLSGRFQGLVQKVRDGFDDGSLTMTGPDMRKLDAFLGQQQRRFGKSDDPFHGEYADAISELQDALRDATERSNPAEATKLAGLNSGYAQLVRLDKAANLAKQTDGVWTPNQLMQAVTSSGMDSSARQTSSARGRALLQDWAKSAKDTLPNKMPDAGNFWTHLPELMVTAGVGHEAGLPAIGKMLAAEGGLAMGYTKPAQASLRALLTRRPEYAKPIANLIEELRPALAWGAVPATQQAATALPALPPTR
jgi:hypothetical protein